MDPSPSLDALIAQLEDPDHEIRSRAAWDLSLRARHHMIPRLLEMLESPSPYVVKTAAEILRQLGHPRTVPPLRAAYERVGTAPEWSDTYWALVRALAKLGDARAKQELRSLPVSSPAAVFRELIEAAEHGDTSALERLITLMRERQDPSLATILGNIGDVCAVEPLCAELARAREPAPDKLFRSSEQDIYFYYLARALGKLGDPRAVPLLEWVRDHETAPVLKGRSISDMAVKALARIRERQGL